VLDGFSGHADLAWSDGQTGGNIAHAFRVHDEPKSMEALTPFLQSFVETPSASPRSNPASKSDHDFFTTEPK
jgi:hypothetical protein